MPDSLQIAAFIAIAAILGITPGPDIIYVIVRSATQGLRMAFQEAA